MTADGVGELRRRAEDVDATPADVHEAVTALLDADPPLGRATVLGILARAPRIKPSPGLVIDPGDAVTRRWQQRVAACRALVASPALAAVLAEVQDELSDCPDLAADVLAG